MSSGTAQVGLSWSICRFMVLKSLYGKMSIMFLLIFHYNVRLHYRGCVTIVRALLLPTTVPQLRDRIGTDGWGKWELT